jgi:hypothetical protein
MKKFLLCAFCVFVVTASFARMDVCRYTYIGGCWAGVGCSSGLVEYSTDNGSCCSPSGGGGSDTYTMQWYSGGSSTVVLNNSSQYYASMNPGCA